MATTHINIVNEAMALKRIEDRFQKCLERLIRAADDGRVAESAATAGQLLELAEHITTLAYSARERIGLYEVQQQQQ
jgi:hypothetical protein